MPAMQRSYFNNYIYTYTDWSILLFSTRTNDKFEPQSPQRKDLKPSVLSALRGKKGKCMVENFTLQAPKYF
jgi:hypothetical protein